MPSTPFSTLRLAQRSLTYYLAHNLAVVLAAAVATAILVGAFVIGDSLRLSLRHRALNRLGRIDHVLVAPGFFRQEWANELAQSADLRKVFSDCVPVLLTQVSVETLGGQAKRATQVQLLGCDSRFWSLQSENGNQQSVVSRLRAREVVVNQAVAEALKIATGDRLIMHVPVARGIPGETALGRRQDVTKPVAVRVAGIVPDRGLGAFALTATQDVPHNAFLDLAWLGEQMDRPGKANVMLFAGSNVERPVDPGKTRVVDDIPVRPEDFGLKVERTPLGYVNITTDRLVFSPQMESLIRRRLKSIPYQPAIIYLAEKACAREREAWYLTVAAMPFSEHPPLGPLRDDKGGVITSLGAQECAVTEWLAQRLAIVVGDSVEVTWFQPEARMGELGRQTAELQVARIVKFEGPAIDPYLVPEVPGLTDKASIADWDPPFPFDASRVTQDDEEYWKEYRATPKLYVSQEFAEQHWRSRFGLVTSFRISKDVRGGVAEIRTRLTVPLKELGWQVIPIKRRSIETSRGTTSFEGLFLGFSMFVLASAILLTAILFVLNLQRRSVELGIVKAVGWPLGLSLRWILLEAAILSLAAGLLGGVLGIGYAAAMIYALNTVWLPAIGVPFLELHPQLPSVALGTALGAAVGLLTTIFAMRSLLWQNPRALLYGQAEVDQGRFGHRWALRATRWLVAAGTLILASLSMVVVGICGSEQTQTAAFFVGGSCVLFGLWAVFRASLEHRSGRRLAAASLSGLTVSFLSRNPRRTALTAILMGSAVFLIVAVGAFKVDPEQLTPRVDSGNGGFTVLGETQQPVFEDLNSPRVHKRLALSEAERELLAGNRIYAMRMKTGDDASCLNLYRPQDPTVLGVGNDLIARDGFRFTAHAPAGKAHGKANPWLHLMRPAEKSGSSDGILVIPAIIDDATAKYSFHLSGSVGERLPFELADGRRIAFEIVGLLDNSIFQGRILISEGNFRDLFPEIAGYRSFLIEPREPPGEEWEGHAQQVAQILTTALIDRGPSFTTTKERLARLLAVQNTYLSTFQSLGGLGLLLGTIGLGAVIFRSLWERRREISLLRAVGFAPQRIQTMVILENFALLGSGIVVGVGAALVAVAPQFALQRAGWPIWPVAQLVLLMVITGLLTGWIAARWILAQPVAAGLRRE